MRQLKLPRCRLINACQCAQGANNYFNYRHYYFITESRLTRPQCKHAVKTTHKHPTWESTNELNKGAENRGLREAQQLLPRIFRQASAELPQKSARKHHRQLLLLHLLHKAYCLLPVCASTNSFRKLFRNSSAKLPRPAFQNTCKTNHFL